MADRFVHHRVGQLHPDLRRRCGAVPDSDLARWLERAGPDWMLLQPTGPEVFLYSSVIAAHDVRGSTTVRLRLTFHNLGGVCEARGGVGRDLDSHHVGTVGVEWLRDDLAPPRLHELGRIMTAGVDTYVGVQAVVAGASVDWVMQWERSQILDKNDSILLQ